MIDLDKLPDAAQLPSETTSRLMAMREPSEALAVQRDLAVSEAIASCRAYAANKRTQRQQAARRKGTKRVLIVDDERALLTVYRRWLLDGGMVEYIDIATSVREALALLEKPGNGYDLLILDYKLANGTAADIVRRVRAWSLVPVILISGYIGRELGAVAQALSATDFLSKHNLTKETLQDAVNHAFAKVAQVENKWT